MTSDPRVGFIGLGSQGAPMARRIVEAGRPLTLWARRPASLEPFADTAAAMASTPRELGEACDIVCICVVADADVEDVVLRGDGVLGGMAPGSVIVVHSTVHPRTVRRLAEVAADRGVAVLDAPVSGGAPAADAGELLVMAGGDAEVLATCTPALATFGDPILHLGPLGAGQMAKLLNNFLFTAHMAAACDVFALAAALSVDRAALADVLTHGSGSSRAAGIVAALGFDVAPLAGSAGLLRKDVSILRDLSQEETATMPAALAALADHAFRLMEP